MFAVDDVLISDAVLDAPFACHLPQCLGGCCVHGDHGAPLEPDERERLEAALPIVERKLWQEALEVIARKGVWIEEEPGKCGTTVVAGRECVFVTYDKAVAKCAHQQAYNVGRLEFEKPISCHRYPLRVEIHGTGSEAIEVLNYEQIRLRKPAIKMVAERIHSWPTSSANLFRASTGPDGTRAFRKPLRAATTPFRSRSTLITGL